MTKVFLTNGDVIQVESVDPECVNIHGDLDVLKIMANDGAVYLVRWSAVDYVEAH